MGSDDSIGDFTDTEPVESFSGKYAKTIMAIYYKKINAKNNLTPGDEIPFGPTDMEEASTDHDIESIANPPDLPYNLRSRGYLPDKLTRNGYTGVIHDLTNTQTGGAYKITTHPQRISLPPVDDITTIDIARIPDLTKMYTRANEPSILSYIQKANLIEQFFDPEPIRECQHIVGNIKLTGPTGQAEIDGLYVIVDSDGKPHAVLIEAKGEDETFTRNQIGKNVLTVRDDDLYPDSVRVLGVKNEPDDLFSITEFTIPGTITDYEDITVARRERYSFGQTSLTEVFDDDDPQTKLEDFLTSTPTVTGPVQTGLNAFQS